MGVDDRVGDRVDDRVDDRLVQMRDVSAIYGRSLRVVRSWRECWPDWPAAVEHHRTSDSRGMLVAFYDAQAVAVCVENHFDPQSTPQRWLAAKVVSELGLQLNTFRARVRQGSFPPPDGHQGRWPWWRPATVNQWAATHLRPAAAWSSQDVADHTGHRADSCIRNGLPVDGMAGTTRWWWPANVRRWWSHHQIAMERLEQPSEQLRPDNAKTDPANGAPHATVSRWFIADIAEVTGLSDGSIRKYRSRRDLTDPNGYTDQGRPWWHPDTIWAWDRDRTRSGPSLSGRPLDPTRRRRAGRVEHHVLPRQVDVQEP